MGGVVAAGHPLTAEAGADVLRAGGNAVDAAVAAVLMSFAAESPLTGPGAGGFMLLHTEGGENHLLDFFVAAPGRGLESLGAGGAPAHRRDLRKAGGAALQRRPLVVRGIRHPQGSGGGTAPLRHAHPGRPHRAGGAGSPRGRRDHAHARRAVHLAGADPALDPGGRGALRPRGPDPEGGGADLPAGARRPARAPRRRGPGLPLHRRRRQGRQRMGAGARAACSRWRTLRATRCWSASPRR